MLKIFRVEFVIHFFLFLNSKLAKKKKKSLHPSKIKRDTRISREFKLYPRHENRRITQRVK